MPPSQTWSVTKPFQPRRWLRNGHAQTIASFLLGRRNLPPPAEERLIEVAPGVRLLCHCNWQADRKSALTVVAVHGLEGSSSSAYMEGIAAKGFAAGMNVVRVNQRNCGGTDHLAPTLYHSGLSADMMRVVESLLSTEGLERVVLTGYSMGGNLMLKAAGEWGSEHPPQLKAVAVVCPAMDLAACADALGERANWLYQLYFVRRLKQRLAEKARLFPSHFNISSGARVTSVREFDDKVTAPFSGFRDANDYYFRASAARVVDRISVPTLILHAKDDPFVRLLPETRAKVQANPAITLVETTHGGHCAFLAKPDGYDGCWAEHEVIAFMRQFGGR
jgi:uncharacterized protein